MKLEGGKDGQEDMCMKGCKGGREVEMDKMGDI